MSIVPAGHTFALEGPLSFDTVPAVLAESATYAGRADLPDRLVVDFARVTTVDSSAVALLLEWLRQAKANGRTLVFVNLPATLVALAGLYGVSELIQPAAAAG